MNRNDTYVLDFVIPQGPFGAMGTPNLESLCFVSFDSITSQNHIRINHSILLPENSNFYHLTDQTITIVEAGIYEITFCGVIDENVDQQNIVIWLRSESLGVTTNLPEMYGRWNSGTQNSYFSQTSIFSFDEPQTLSLFIEVPGATNFLIQFVNLVVRKLPFSVSTETD